MTVFTKHCATCTKLLPIADFYSDSSRKDGLARECKLCTYYRIQKWRKDNPERDKENKRRWHLKNHDKKLVYNWKEKGINITLNDYNARLSKQDYRCAICNRFYREFKKGLAPDHCHISGRIRGLLCTNCNVGLGHFKDDSTLLLKAVKYLGESCH